MEEENKIVPEVKVHAPEGVEIEVRVEYDDGTTVKTEEVVAEELVVEEAPVEEVAPVEEAPVEEAVPEEEAPVEEPVEEKPTEETPSEEKPAEEGDLSETRIVATPEELEARIAELEEKNAEARAKIEALKARKNELLHQKVDELYEDYKAALKNIEECCTTITGSLMGVQDDFGDDIKKVNDAYAENQLEKVTLKGREVK